MASIVIVFRKDKLNKKSEAPIHFRIIKNRKITYITSGIMLNASHWDYKKNKIKSTHPNSARLNSFLTNRFNELQDQVFEYETAQKSLTTRQLKDKIFGKKPTDFFAFAEEVIQSYHQEGKIGTYDKNRSILKKLSDYVGGKSLSFQDITPEFLTKYEKYLREIHKNKINTIHRDFKFFRKLFNDAYSKELIEHQLIPFNKYKLKTEKTQRSFLTDEELKLIEDFQTTKSILELHKDMFVFAAYAGGLRISDILQLKWKHFDGQHISFTMKKTSNQISIKVPNKGLDIINKYKPEKMNKNSFIFPVFHEDLDLNNAIQLDLSISRASAYINKNLKIIAKKLGIEKRISFHVSRHTFATRALRKGISIDKVSKLLGHSSIKDTQIYAKIVNSELDKAMDIFND